MTIVRVKSGDTQTFTSTLTSGGVAVNLTGASVAFLVRLVESPGTAYSFSASIVSAVAGTVSYTSSGDFPTATGKYRQEWQVTSSSGVITTYPNDDYNFVIILDSISTDSSSPYTFRAGPVNNPATGTGSSTIGLPFFAAECLPTHSHLTKFQCFLSGIDSVQILLASPAANGGFDISVVATKVGAAGLNTWTLDDGDFPATIIPAKGLVGAKTGGTEAIRLIDDNIEYGRSRSAGYHFPAAYSGAGNYQLINAYTNEVQLAWESSVVRSSAAFIVNESFGTSKPAYAEHVGTAWTYSAGSATPGATGIANRMYWYPSSNLHQQTLQVDFQFDNASGKLCIGKEIALDGASVDYGSLAAIDIATNEIELYNPYNTAGILPTVRYTESITAMTLVTGRTYRFEMVKLNKKISIRITDLTTSDTQLFEWTVNELYGYGFGRPVMFSMAGTLHLTRVRWFFGNVSPRFMIFGDSITEGSGPDNHLSGYAAELCESGLGMFAGDGGVPAIACLREMQHQIRISMPQYVVMVAGANNSNTDDFRDQYILDMRTFADKARQYGITPIIATVTPFDDSTRQTRIDAMNAAIFADETADGLAVVDLTQALGLTWSAVYFADSVHPNQLGNDEMYAQFIADQPDAFT